jgi:hypothetical protein
VSDNPKRKWYQFSLRTLLSVSVLLALFCGWWFHPFVMETRRDDNSLRTRFEVRRDWRGRYVSYGTQTWFFCDGTRFTRSDFGTPLEDDLFLSLLSTREGDFDSLIWHITETIEPDSWSSS